MYRFHYCYMKANFQARARLLFTDTDSLMYEIDCGYKQVYESFSKNNKSKKERMFDFSSLPADHFCYNDENRRVVGKFKDESSGDPILEFVGLRPKMYSFTTLNQANLVKEKHRAKGIQYAAAKVLTHAQYIQQLEHPDENRLDNRRIGSNLHVLYTFATSKRALCAFDDKRYLCPDGIHTLAFGHKDLPKFVQVIVDAEHPMDEDAADLLAQEAAEAEQDRAQERRRVENAQEETRQMAVAANLIAEVEGEMEGEAAAAAGVFEDADYEAVAPTPAAPIVAEETVAAAPIAAQDPVAARAPPSLSVVDALIAEEEAAVAVAAAALPALSPEDASLLALADPVALASGLNVFDEDILFSLL